MNKSFKIYSEVYCIARFEQNEVTMISGNHNLLRSGFKTTYRRSKVFPLSSGSGHQWPPGRSMTVHGGCVLSYSLDPTFWGFHLVTAVRYHRLCHRDLCDPPRICLPRPSLTHYQTVHVGWYGIQTAKDITHNTMAWRKHRKTLQDVGPLFNHPQLAHS